MLNGDEWQAQCGEILNQSLFQCDEQQKKFYCISVEDNGIGFDQKDAERIFHVFTRLAVRNIEAPPWGYPLFLK